MSIPRKLGVLAVAASICIFESSAQSVPPRPQTSPSQLTDTPVAPPHSEASRLAGIAKDDSRHFGSDPNDPGPLAKDLSPAITPAAVGAAMRKVADWQLAESQQYFTTIDKASQLDGRIWTWSVLYTGYMAAASSLNESKYRDAMKQVGKAYNWGLRSELPSGDDMSIAQMYIELYLKDKQPQQIAPIQTALNNILAAPRVELGSAQKIAWWWCDALFMAPPTWARMYAASGDRKYITYLDEEFTKTDQQLYDPHAHLYSRDATFIHATEKNGQKLFWARGEGWVMGGLARTLEYLPNNDPARVKYETQLKEMAAAVAKIQGKDGLWTSGLLDPAAYNNQPEISGSALMTFGIAWGINNGILDRKLHTPVVTKAWAGMLRHIYADDRLGDIQQTGAQPSSFKPSASYTYGVGGFLLAGSEIHKMVEEDHPKK